MALPLLPLFFRELQSFDRAKRFLILGLCTLVTASLLPIMTLALDVDRQFDWGYYFTEILNLAQMLILIVTVLALICLIGLTPTLLSVCVGAIMNYIQVADLDIFSNPWKYYFAWPVTLLLVVLCSKWKYPFNVLPFLVAAAIGAGAESRNAMAVSAACAFILLFATATSRLGIASIRKMGSLIAIAMAGILVVAPAYFSWISQGGLGENLKTRQIAQLEVGILGSRVESSVGVGLLLNSPIGIGAGVKPSTGDATAGMNSFRTLLNPNPNTIDYVESRVLGETVRLHSLLFDLWAVASAPGLLFGFAALKILGQGLLRAGRTSIGFASVIFLSIQAFWDLFFSGLVGIAKYCAVALAVALWLLESANSRRDTNEIAI
jgi:hypothetical protein